MKKMRYPILLTLVTLFMLYIYEPIIIYNVTFFDYYSINNNDYFLYNLLFIIKTSE